MNGHDLDGRASASLLPSAAGLPPICPTWAPLLAQLKATLFNEAPPPCATVHASNASSTLNLLLRSLLSELDDTSILPRYVFVDCLILHSPKAIYNHILNTLASWQPKYASPLGGAQNWDGRVDLPERDDERPSKRARLDWDTTEAPAPSLAKGALGGHVDDSLAAFLEGLQAIFQIDSELETHQKALPRFILFENAERLANMSQTAATAGITALEDNVNEGAFLAALTRLTEMSGKSVIPIFISQLDFLKYRPRMGRALEPGPASKFQVPRLQKEDMVNLLMFYFVPSTSLVSHATQRNLFQSFAGLIYDTFSAHLDSTSPLEELATLCSGSLWPKWLGWVEAEQVPATDIARLANLLKPSLADAFNTLGGLIPFSAGGKLDSGELKLTTIGSYLLIAGYLASYNPARTDVRLLAVEAEEGLNGPKKKGKRKQKSFTKRKGDASRLTGPKAFPIERLLAIFECLLPEEQVDLAGTTDVYSEIASLLSLRLLTRTSVGSGNTIERLDGIKLKCNLEWEAVEKIGQTVGMRVIDRLWNTED